MCGEPRNDAEFITVTIGGNDLFGPILEASASDPTDPTCAPTIQSIFATYQGNLATIFGSCES